MKDFTTEKCVQPVSYAPAPADVEVVTNDVNGLQVWLIPLMGDLEMTAEEAEEVEVCDPQPAYIDDLVEVQFGRLSVSRAPMKVLDARLAEAMAALTTPWATITLDHAGRLAFTVDGVEKTIDAPLENLALDKRLQEYGFLAGVELPSPIAGYGFLDHAGAFFGAAADKPGKITEDSILYMNPVLLTAKDLAVPVIYGDGDVGQDGVRYVDYSGYTYNRALTYPGCVQGIALDENNQSIPFNKDLMDVVFGGSQFTGSNVNAFATRADDARAVGTWVHDAIDAGMWVQEVDRLGETTVCE